MKHVYEGKTKSVFELENGNILLRCKDDVTGADGVFDPGANIVGAVIEGMGRGSIAMSTYFFGLLSQNDIPHHFISSDIEKAEMIVHPAAVFGKGVEVVCRLKATGSFVRRYGEYVQDGAPLDYLVEVTLKDDVREDPLIGAEALEQLKIMTQQEYAQLSSMTKRIAAIIAKDMAAKGLELYDIKFEFGRIGNEIALIDEIAAGNMRVYKNGQLMKPLELIAKHM